MKAVIVEARNKMAAALSVNGQVIIIKNRNYGIGEVIELEKKHSYKTGKLFVRVAAAAVVAVMCSVGAYAYYTPYSYVSLDVNPSFEYTLNRFNIVLSARSLGADQILDETELKNLNNKNIRQAIAETVEHMREDGYLNEGEENGIYIAVSNKNKEKSDKLAQELQQSVEKGTEESENVEIKTSSVKKEIIEEANELGVSAGKLGLVESLQESAGEEEINRDEWLNKPVKEIMEAIKENKKEEKEEIKDNRQEEINNKHGDKSR